jgi:hypothetical protein
MNREIKFRIFSQIFNENKMFHDVEYILKSDGYWWKFNNGTRLSQNSDRIKIMQYVGFNDCNDYPIYEGDLVELETNHIADLTSDPKYLTKKVYEVSFKNGIFLIGDMSMDYGGLKRGKLTVKGNIYEKL